MQKKKKNIDKSRAVKYLEVLTYLFFSGKFSFVSENLKMFQHLSCRSDLVSGGTM